jgi:hypothetical protein
MPADLPPKFLHQLKVAWLQLRGKWSWLAMVPGERDLSTAGIARALCSVASQLSIDPIGFVEAKDVDLDTASRLIGQLGSANASVNARPIFSRPLLSADNSEPQVTQWIVALESPLANPLALPVALAADGVVLCVRRGRSTIAEVRQTIEAVGADRVVCCLLMD